MKRTSQAPFVLLVSALVLCAPLVARAQSKQPPDPRLQPVQRGARRRDRTPVRSGGRAAAPDAERSERGPLPQRDRHQAGGAGSGRALSLRDQGRERSGDQRLRAARRPDVREPRPVRGGAKRGGAGRRAGPRDGARGAAPRDPPGLEGLSRPGRPRHTGRAARQERRQHGADRGRGRRPGVERALPQVRPRRRVPGRPDRSGPSWPQPGTTPWPWPTSSISSARAGS